MISTHKIDAHLGARLRALRQHQHLSKELLAARVGVSRQEIDSYEAGAPMTAARLFQVARALETSSVSLFFDGLNDVSAHPPSPNERFLLLKRAIQRIAANHEVTAGGHRKRLSRNDAVTMAREVCEKMGWRYGHSRKPAAAE